MANVRHRLPTATFYVVFLSLLVFLQFSLPVAADGTGMLGFGKVLYKPPCAHACRAIISSSELNCNSEISTTGEASSTSGQHAHSKRHGHTAPATEECYLKDAAFLRTLAFCIYERCPATGVSTAAIENYWEGHVASGDVGNWKLRPSVSYQEALQRAHADMEGQERADMPYIHHGEPLTVTSMISDDDWLPEYNGRVYFERNEWDHGKNGYISPPHS